MRSMTGYSRVEAMRGSYQFRVEVKSLNSKTLNVILQIPGFLSSKELELNSLVEEYVKRGRVTVRVNVKFLEPPKLVEIDKNALTSYHALLENVVTTLSLPEPVKLSDLLNFRELFRFDLSDEEIESIWQSLVPVLREALERLVQERMKEGERLRKDLQNILENLKVKVDGIERLAGELNKVYRERLRDELRRLLPDGVEVKEDVLENHLAAIAVRADIREELVRLKSHIARAFELFNADEPVGTYLDFVSQEMLRELNTILSKSILKEISELALDGKVLVAQFREQVQNVE